MGEMMGVSGGNTYPASAEVTYEWASVTLGVRPSGVIVWQVGQQSTGKVELLFRASLSYETGYLLTITYDANTDTYTTTISQNGGVANVQLLSQTRHGDEYTFEIKTWYGAEVRMSTVSCTMRRRKVIKYIEKR